MIYELRHYLIKRHEVDEYIGVFRKYIVPNLELCGFRLIGAWATSVGLNAGRADIRYLLQWDSLAQRELCNNKLLGQSWYPEFAKVAAPHITYAQSRIMEPLDWSPLQ
jgi:hypothetical protein